MRSQFHKLAARIKFTKTLFNVLIFAVFLFNFTTIAEAQALKGKWSGGVHTKLTERGAEMGLTADAKGWKKFHFYNFFYFYDTQDHHECSNNFKRGDGVSKWRTRGKVTTITYNFDNDTILRKLKTDS